MNEMLPIKMRRVFLFAKNVPICIVIWSFNIPWFWIVRVGRIQWWSYFITCRHNLLFFEIITNPNIFPFMTSTIVIVWIEIQKIFWMWWKWIWYNFNCVVIMNISSCLISKVFNNSIKFFLTILLTFFFIFISKILEMIQ